MCFADYVRLNGPAILGLGRCYRSSNTENFKAFRNWEMGFCCADVKDGVKAESWLMSLYGTVYFITSRPAHTARHNCLISKTYIHLKKQKKLLRLKKKCYTCFISQYAGVSYRLVAL